MRTASVIWNHVSNPVLSMTGWSLKDACVVEHDGQFHLFTSAFNEERSTVIHLASPDFVTWGPVLHLWSGQELDAVGLCSPAIRKVENRFIVCFNTWGQPMPPGNDLYYTESVDLKEFSELRPLAANLTKGKQAVDIDLAPYADGWIAHWKQGNAACAASAPALDGPWAFIGDDPVQLLRHDGTDATDTDKFHENVQLLRLGGIWHLLTTDYPPHEPWLYRMDGDPDDAKSWLQWVEGRHIRVPTEEFNSIPSAFVGMAADNLRCSTYPCWDQPGRVHLVDGLSNAPFLLDRRDTDGYVYLLCSGKNEVLWDRFRGTAAGGNDAVSGWPRGWNRPALSRSRDLLTWMPAGRGGV